MCVQKVSYAKHRVDFESQAEMIQNIVKTATTQPFLLGMVWFLVPAPKRGQPDSISEYSLEVQQQTSLAKFLMHS